MIDPVSFESMAPAGAIDSNAKANGLKWSFFGPQPIAGQKKCFFDEKIVFGEKKFSANFVFSANNLFFVENTFYHVETFFQTYKPEKKSIRVVFRDELDGDVRFNVALPKLTKNDEKRTC